MLKLFTVTITAALFTFTVSLPLLAQTFEPCVGSLANCSPPATFTYVNAPPPFNAPVRFGREFRKGGVRVWSWIKAGEPSRPCTAQEIAQGEGYKRACNAKIGEELYQIEARVILVK